MAGNALRFAPGRPAMTAFLMDNSDPLLCMGTIESCPSQGRARLFGDKLGRDVELLVNILVRTAGAKRMHPDEFALRSQIALPAERRRRFDADAHVRLAKHLSTIGLGLFLEQIPAGHGDYACSDVLG